MSAVPRFEVLGPLRVTRGQEELPLGPAKQQAVLATLLATPNQVVPTARIIDAVWGDEPPVNGTNVVQKYVAGLRRVLEPDRAPRSAGELLVLEAGGYRLAVAPGGSDADEFETQVRSARALQQSGQSEEASQQLEQALSLWRGEPFEGFTGTAFDDARRRLTELRAEVDSEIGGPGAVRTASEQVGAEQTTTSQVGVLRRGGRDWSLGRGWPVAMTDLIPPQRPRSGRVLMKIVAILISLVTLGLGAGVLMAVVAYLRRSRPLTQFAALYLVMWLAGAVFFLIGAEDGAGAVNNLGYVLILLVTVIGTIHLAFSVAPVSVRRIRALAALNQRIRARQVIESDPDYARTLGIGRPHLHREYDDGGLIDPNEVPPGVLTRIPGVTAQHAALIVASREEQGPFSSVAELADRGLFPSPLPDAVATFLVVLPPAGDPATT